MKNIQTPLPNILLVGTKGTGKTTQAELLQKKYGYIVLNLGQRLRKLGENVPAVQKVVANGLPISAQLLRNILEDFLIEHTSSPIILDGSPYTIEQLDVYNKLIQDYDLNISVIECTTKNHNLLLERLSKRNRLDSHKDSMFLEQYKKDIEKLHRQIDYVNFFTIDASQSIDEVSIKIESILFKK